MWQKRSQRGILVDTTYNDGCQCDRHWPLRNCNAATCHCWVSWPLRAKRHEWPYFWVSFTFLLGNVWTSLFSAVLYSSTLVWKRLFFKWMKMSELHKCSIWRGCYTKTDITAIYNEPRNSNYAKCHGRVSWHHGVNDFLWGPLGVLYSLVQDRLQTSTVAVCCV